MDQVLAFRPKKLGDRHASFTSLPEALIVEVVRFVEQAHQPLISFVDLRLVSRQFNEPSCTFCSSMNGSITIPLPPLEIGSTKATGDEGVLCAI